MLRNDGPNVMPALGAGKNVLLSFPIDLARIGPRLLRLAAAQRDLKFKLSVLVFAFRLRNNRLGWGIIKMRILGIVALCAG
jgi:hypothetical protein